MKRKGHPSTPETNKKISAALKGKPKSPEHRAALVEAWKNRKPSQKMLDHINRINKLPRSEEQLKKQAASISKTMKGRPRTPAQQEALKKGQARLREMILKGELPPRTATVGLFAIHGATLREQDGDLCQLCLEPIDFDLPMRTKWSRSVDHIRPARADGSDELDNLWLAHMWCNQSKGARFIGRADGTTDRRR